MVIDQFIELDRRFRDVTEKDDPEETAFRSYTASFLGIEPEFGWAKVLGSRIIVILGEPGSGKTWELRNQSKKMKEQGIPAFFVSLDRLVDATLSEVILPDDEVMFQAWTRSNKPATFFLDSVDEAKIRK